MNTDKSMKLEVGDMLFMPNPENPECWHKSWHQFFGKFCILVEEEGCVGFGRYKEIHVYFPELMNYSKMIKDWLIKYDCDWS